MRTVTEITNNPNLKYTLIGATSDGVHFYKEEVNVESYKQKELSQKQREQIIKEKINNWEHNIAIKERIEYELPEVVEEEIVYKLPEVVEDKQIEIPQERREEMLQEAISKWGQNVSIKKHIEYELPEVIEEEIVLEKVERKLPEVITEDIVLDKVEYKLSEVVDQIMNKNINNREKINVQERKTVIKENIEYELPKVVKKVIHDDYSYNLNVDTKHKFIRVTNDHTGKVSIYQTIGIPTRVVLNKNILTYEDLVDEYFVNMNYTINVDDDKIIIKQLKESETSSDISWDSGDPSPFSIRQLQYYFDFQGETVETVPGIFYSHDPFNLLEDFEDETIETVPGIFYNQDEGQELFNLLENFQGETIETLSGTFYSQP